MKTWNDLSQTERVIRYMQRHRKTGITPVLAREVLEVQRLAPRIFEAKQQGYLIRTEYLKDEMGKRFTRYVLR